MTAPTGQPAKPQPSPATATASLRADLRAATCAAHRQLDASFSAFDLTDPGAYRRFLEAHAVVFPHCEATLAASDAQSLMPDWPDRVRTPALAEDLAAVGGRGLVTPSTAKPIAPAAAFGMMYVLEGSRLGGAVLARRVQHNSDPRCRDATRYLRHGAGLSLWPSFIATLENADCVRDDIGGAIASALHTFELFAKAARSADPAPME